VATAAERVGLTPTGYVGEAALAVAIWRARRRAGTGYPRRAATASTPAMSRSMPKR
jgi:hypothetical protein